MAKNQNPYFQKNVLQPQPQIVNAVVKMAPPSKPSEHKISGKQTPDRRVTPVSLPD